MGSAPPPLTENYFATKNIAELGGTPSLRLPFMNPPSSLRFTLVYNPLLAMVFVAVYWIIGLFHAYFV